MKPLTLTDEEKERCGHVFVHADEFDQAAQLMDRAYMALMTGAKNLGTMVLPVAPIPN